MSVWKPEEIMVHKEVQDDPVTEHFLSQCPGVPVRMVASSRANDVVAASGVLSRAGGSILEKVLAGKKVVFISPAGRAVDVFEMPG